MRTFFYNLLSLIKNISLNSDKFNKIYIYEITYRNL